MVPDDNTLRLAATGALTACQAIPKRLDIMWIGENGQLEVIAHGSGKNEAAYSRVSYAIYETPFSDPERLHIHGGGSGRVRERARV